MVDQMVLATQKWLNETYRSKTGFGSVEETGQTGWPTIYALTRALQIELGITAPVNNFGAGTQARFTSRWPDGISKSDAESNVHGIIQGALWCKGYTAEYGGITRKFTDRVATSIRLLKADIGIGGDSAEIDLELMMALLSMKQFKLLEEYDGNSAIRYAQQTINKGYKNYTGIIPTDGLYGREMNKALIQVLQAIEGFTPAEATGNFGAGTRARLQTIGSGTSSWVWLASVALVCNGYSLSPNSTWNTTLATTIGEFQKDLALKETGVVDPTTWMSLLTSKGDPDRHAIACDTRFEITDELAQHLKADGYQIVGRYILPYFQAVTAHLGGGYRVGIYASRNICSRVAQAGYAVASFVSDMSTGFSGNLGFPIPSNWVFDQFHEISRYRGKWDLDRVAYSGRLPAVSAVRTVAPSDYPTMGLIDLIEAFENRFEELRTIHQDSAFGKDPVVNPRNVTWIEIPTWRCVLNYLSKAYLKGSIKWATSAEAYREIDAMKLEADNEAAQIISSLEKWIGPGRGTWTDPSGGVVDIAHMAVTTLGYININPLVPDKWTGWAGDLASALGPIQKVVDLNPGADRNAIAKALIGQGDDYKNHPALSGLNIPAGLPNNCNYSDLCSDGDAIAIAEALGGSGGGNPSLLSQTLRGYYNNHVMLGQRFTKIATSIGANDLASAKEKFFKELDDYLNSIYVGLLIDGEDGAIGYSEIPVEIDVKRAGCDALAEFIY